MDPQPMQGWEGKGSWRKIYDAFAPPIFQRFRGLITTDPSHGAAPQTGVKPVTAENDFFMTSRGTCSYILCQVSLLEEKRLFETVLMTFL